MKKTIIAFAAITLLACNNSKKDPAPETNNQGTDAPPTTTTTTPAPAANTNSVITIEGKELNLNGSILVDKDKKKLLAGAPYRGMITSSSGCA